MFKFLESTLKDAREAFVDRKVNNGSKTITDTDRLTGRVDVYGFKKTGAVTSKQASQRLKEFESASKRQAKSEHSHRVMDRQGRTHYSRDFNGNLSVDTGVHVRGHADATRNLGRHTLKLW
jgi:hypothetical protein